MAQIKEYLKYLQVSQKHRSRTLLRYTNSSEKYRNIFFIITKYHMQSVISVQVYNQLI
jgi:hypothetical protein